MTRMLEDTADERARLANMALADCGLPEVVRVDERDEVHIPFRNLAGRKAVRLATMAVHGPNMPMRCDTCLNAMQWSDCERIPVADALRGRTCGKHGGTA